MPNRPLPEWCTLFVHLRLHYQLIFLSPLFGWGFLLSGVNDSMRALVGFVSFHVFLYGGITAFNSYYDRDQGPVGGLRSPPRVSEKLFGFALVTQALGLLGAILVGRLFTLIYLIVVVLSVAYSHPRFRWKGRPVLSLLVVALGQGAIGYCAGWLCGELPASAMLSVNGALGLASATLFTVGLFPLTQLYQIDEDRARGDATFAVAFGQRASFAFAFTCLALSAVCITTLAGRLFGAVDAVLVLVGHLCLLFFLDRWRLRFRNDVLPNFITLHRMQYALSIATLSYIALHAFTGQGNGEQMHSPKPRAGSSGDERQYPCQRLTCGPPRGVRTA